MLDSSIWPIDRTLSGATTSDQSEPESNGNEEVLCVPQSITVASPSDCLVTYPGHSLEGVLPLCRDAVGLFYGPPLLWESCFIIYLLWVTVLFGLVGRVFANGLGDLGSILRRVIPKTLKIVLDTSLLNTQQYKVHIKGKVEQSSESSSTHAYTLV